MELSEFDYELPKELIAQNPLDKRSESKLLVYKDKQIQEKQFYNILDLLEKDDVLVLNETKVIKSKILGKKETGGKVEITITKKLSELEFISYIKIRNPKIKTKIIFEDDDSKEKLFCTIKDIADFQFKIEFNKSPKEYIEKNGFVTIPPYVKKKVCEKKYQTIYAKKEGSIAAPTAGLHFTNELLKKLKEKGVIITTVCLHVGIGTFAPVKTKQIEDHNMHEEYYTITKETANIINNRKKKLYLVGTTSLRALESSCDEKGKINPKSTNTNIFIYPGYKFKLNFDALITNFHLPKSTLLMLISAILTKEEVFKIYKFAISKKYRFFSFGDATILYKK